MPYPLGHRATDIRKESVVYKNYLLLPYQIIYIKPFVSKLGVIQLIKARTLTVFKFSEENLGRSSCLQQGCSEKLSQESKKNIHGGVLLLVVFQAAPLI